MTRKLPWKRASEAAVKDETGSPRTPVSRTFSRPSPQISRGPTPLVASSRSTPASAGSHAYRPARTPSTSPPPQPLAEQHMIEGLDNDDKYRMVEDEFVDMAGQFTAYLHRAEYQRLKNQAESQNAETIANISRPVVGSLTEIARKRQEEVLRKRKRQEALRKARGNAGIQDDSADEDDAPWRGTALQGLMDNRRKDEVPLARLVRNPPATSRQSLTQQNQHHLESTTSTITASPSSALQRARRTIPNQGQKRSFDETETESDDDDLGAGVPNRARVPTAGGSAARRTHATPIARQPPSAMKNTALQISKSVPRHRVTESVSTPSKALSSPVVKETSDSEDSDPFTSFRDRRRRDKDRKRPVKTEKDQGSKIPDIIPTFLL